MTERKLDHVIKFDERSRAYPVRAVLKPTVVRKKKLWKIGEILDQGQEGSCSGNSFADEAMASPVRVKFANVVRLPEALRHTPDTEKVAQYIYSEAKKIDGDPHSEGTTTIATVTVMKNLGLVKEYRWAFGIDDVIDTVVSKGPVCIGIPWYYNMYETLPGGLVKLGGNLVGGHALCVVGYDPAKKFPDGSTEEVLIWQNSWGTSYGDNGLGYVKVADLADLLKQGEACVIVKRGLGTR